MLSGFVFGARCMGYLKNSSLGFPPGISSFCRVLDLSFMLQKQKGTQNIRWPSFLWTVQKWYILYLGCLQSCCSSQRTPQHPPPHTHLCAGEGKFHLSRVSLWSGSHRIYKLKGTRWQQAGENTDKGHWCRRSGGRKAANSKKRLKASYCSKSKCSGWVLRTRGNPTASSK